MTPVSQREQAETFRRLHQGPGLLILPNAWDVATARLVEAAGFPAVATTSAGVAWALGYPDGERISRDEMLAVVRRIAAAVRVPVTADLEAGYGAPAPTLGELARLGVRRASLGPRLPQAALGFVRRMLTELRARGTYSAMAEAVIPFAELQRLVTPAP